MKYEIKRVSDGKSLGTVFLDKKGNVDTSPPNLKTILKGVHVTQATIDDGEKYMKELPKLSRSGYLDVQKIEE